MKNGINWACFVTVDYDFFKILVHAVKLSLLCNLHHTFVRQVELLMMVTEFTVIVSRCLLLSFFINFYYFIEQGRFPIV